MSSIPTPPASLAPDADEGRPSSKVTTKVGQPPAPGLQVEPESVRITSKVTTKVGHPTPALPAPTPTHAATAPIGESIQRMLDSQAAVPVEELGEMEELPPEALREVPPEEVSIPELALDEVLESFSEPEPAPIPRVEPAPAAEPVDASRALSEPQMLAKVALRKHELPIAREEITASSRLPVLVKGAVHPEARLDDIDAATPRKLAAAAVRSAERRSTAKGPVVSSLAPAELVARKQRDRREAGTGFLLVAAMAVIGLGGWLLTRGTYPGPRRGVAAPAAAAAAAAVQPPMVAAPEPAAPTAAPPSLALTPALEQPSEPRREPAVADRSPEGGSAAKRPRKAAETTKPGTEATEPEQESAAPEPEPPGPGVIKITRHGASGADPEVPAREDVLAALEPLRAAVRECAQGQRGVAQLDITVASTGLVTHAVVAGDFAGTPEGSCIARVARSARFITFQKPRFRVIYPFSL